MKTMLTGGAIALSLLVSKAYAQAAQWQQCGGIGWSGATTCATGLTCTAMNPYYSQCLQQGSSTIASTTASSTTSSAPTSTSASSAPASTGFVTTSGTKFMLDGSEYTVVGSNSYWVGLMGFSTANMNAAFADIAKTGATTVRTWGFNDVTSATKANYPIYYQSWSGSTPTINTGSTGLANFDNVIATAKANGLRLIVALTNNWSDYGGMDVYVNSIVGSGQPHDLFYTNANVMAAYRNYIKAFVSRYVNEPTIMAWELANEPRCGGSTGTTSGTCTTKTITNWATTISAYIKSIDSNHLVAIGDEGFFNQPGSSDYPYQGGEGIDFTANLKIPSLDFGTFHLYPESWGEGANPSAWGAQWITDHATVQKSTNKPVIVEEFGVTSNQATTYTNWFSTIISSGLSGDLIWQAGSHLSTSSTPDDGYAIYPDDPVYALDTSHAAALKSRG